jgi:hypothetical protein
MGIPKIMEVSLIDAKPTCPFPTVWATKILVITRLTHPFGFRKIFRTTDFFSEVGGILANGRHNDLLSESSPKRIVLQK